MEGGGLFVLTGEVLDPNAETHCRKATLDS